MKIIFTIILTFLYFVIFLVNAQGKERHVPVVQHKYTNQLIHENSPYLLQHAHNPVNWYPWGKSGFEKAEKENKLIIVSIGYSSCHWCHVMEVESFENEEIAFRYFTIASRMNILFHKDILYNDKIQE